MLTDGYACPMMTDMSKPNAAKKTAARLADGRVNRHGKRRSRNVDSYRYAAIVNAINEKAAVS